MAYLTLLLEAKVWTSSAWGAIINLFSFIGNYGWMIIVFTVCLKLVLSPFDFMQKHTAQKNQKMMAIMQPELDKIQKKYGDNKEMIQQKQMEIYKKHNYNLVGSCLLMLVGMAVPMFIFFSLFSSLNQISAIKIYNQYDALKLGYNTEYTRQIDEGASEEQATASAQEYVLKLYNTEEKESWLWIDNVWKGDKATSIVPTYKEYLSFIANALTEEEAAALEARSEEQIKADEDEYNKVMASISAQETGWNGYYILSIVAGLVTYLTSWLAQRASKNKVKDELKAEKKNVSDEQVATSGVNGVMTFVLPIIMVIFTLTSNAVFSLYIIVSSLMGMALQPLFNLIFKAIDKKAESNKKKVTVGATDYSRDKLFK